MEERRSAGIFIFVLIDMCLLGFIFWKLLPDTINSFKTVMDWFDSVYVRLVFGLICSLFVVPPLILFIASFLVLKLRPKARMLSLYLTPLVAVEFFYYYRSWEPLKELLYLYLLCTVSYSAIHSWYFTRSNVKEQFK